ncbi:MAG: hypothetical protein ACKO38_04470, partial [Planctomycetota bacterium]
GLPSPSRGASDLRKPEAPVTVARESRSCHGGESVPLLSRWRERPTPLANMANWATTATD